MDYFTSDTHFNHANIITYCNRPFKDINHMNHTMLNNWNRRVTNNDRVYHLGDFAMGNKNHWSRFCKALNGHKILIRGNHDKSKDFMLSIGFDEVYEELIYGGMPDINDHRLLIHNPLGAFDLGSVEKAMCGHVHTAWKEDLDRNIINVGVDVRNFEPKTLKELLDDYERTKNGRD